MKSFTHIVKSIGAVSLFALALGVAPTTWAGPGLQHWQTLRGEQQFKQLKAGEKIAYVCNQCKSVSELAVNSPEQAMELCKEGSTVTCPSCSKKTKIVMKRQRNDPPTHSKVVYVNEKGEECAFIAKIVASE
ncbi:MAG TPA: hypothetical protein VL069_10120 [Opitutus sp.]|nr:hypothetical protein [Opitutus sp.]